MDSHEEDIKVFVCPQRYMHETSVDPIYNLFERRDIVF